MWYERDFCTRGYPVCGTNELFAQNWLFTGEDEGALARELPAERVAALVKGAQLADLLDTGIFLYRCRSRF